VSSSQEASSNVPLAFVMRTSDVGVRTHVYPRPRRAISDLEDEAFVSAWSSMTPLLAGVAGLGGYRARLPFLRPPDVHALWRSARGLRWPLAPRCGRGDRQHR